MFDVRNRRVAQIVQDYEAMSREVLEQYGRVEHQLTTPADAKLSQLVDHSERMIDSMEVKLHQDIMHAIVLYMPKAVESRMVVSYYDMTSDMERVGDLLENSHRALQNVYREGAVFTELKDDFERQFAQVRKNLQTAIFAFTCGEPDTARALLDDDQPIDHLHREICQVLPSLIAEHGARQDEATTALSLFSLSHALERIGDHSSNLAEATIYTYVGQFVRHGGAE